jgi:hypothetical protein
MLQGTSNDAASFVRQTSQRPDVSAAVRHDVSAADVKIDASATLG